MSFINYYLTLGVSAQASELDITIAYKRLAKLWHPDANIGKDTTRIMQQISEAYSVLKDTEKRKLYDIEYYKYVESKERNEKKEINITRCYYCSKNIAHSNYTRRENFYKVTKRTSFPQRKVFYKTIEVKIPRCEKCFGIHNSRPKVYFFLPVISYAILGLLLGLTILGTWIAFTILGGFLGFLFGSLLSSIDDTLIAKENGIKKESDYSAVEFINQLFNDGWTTNKPKA